MKRIRYEFFQRERVLAIDPMHQGFGYVVLEDEPLQLVDWGQSLCRRRNHGSCLQSLARLIERCSPTALVLESADGATASRQLAMTRFIESISELLDSPGLPVFTYARETVRTLFAGSSAFTKQQRAELLAVRFPELAPKLPPPRAVWSSEDSRMSIFDALALALTDLNERGALSTEK